MLTFSFIEDSEALDAAQSSWERLTNTVSGNNQLFQEWIWVRSWWANFGAQGGYQLRILVARQHGEIVLIWPWVARKRAGLQILEHPGGQFFCFHDALVADQLIDTDILAQAWQTLLQESNADAIELKAVHEDALIAELLHRVGGTPVSLDRAPVVDLTAYADFDGYLASRSKKMRQNQRRSSRQLNTLGKTIAYGKDPHIELPEALDLLFAFKQRWLDERQLSGQQLLSEQTYSFLQALGDYYDSNRVATKLCISSVYLDEQPISIGIGFRQGNQHMEYLAGFDFDKEQFGAGRLRMEYGLRQCFADNLAAYNMLTPATDFKKIWTAQSAEVRHYLVALSTLGKVYRNLYRRRARPLLKNLYARLPSRLKSVVLPFR